MAGSSVVEGRLVDRMCTQPTPEPRLPAAWPSAGREALHRWRRTSARPPPTSRPVTTSVPGGCRPDVPW